MITNTYKVIAQTLEGALTIEFQQSEYFIQLGDPLGHSEWQRTTDRNEAIAIVRKYLGELSPIVFLTMPMVDNWVKMELTGCLTGSDSYWVIPSPLVSAIRGYDRIAESLLEPCFVGEIGHEWGILRDGLNPLLPFLRQIDLQNGWDYTPDPPSLVK